MKIGEVPDEVVASFQHSFRNIITSMKECIAALREGKGDRKMILDGMAIQVAALEMLLIDPPQ